MGRKREINRDQAQVLAGLGHKIHYFYDPAEAVGRPNGKATLSRKRFRRTSGKDRSAFISMTGRVFSKANHSLAIGAVYGATKTVLHRAGPDRLRRRNLVERVSHDMGRTAKAVNVQISHLLKSGHVKQENAKA